MGGNTADRQEAWDGSEREIDAIQNVSQSKTPETIMESNWYLRGLLFSPAPGVVIEMDCNGGNGFGFT